MPQSAAPSHEVRAQLRLARGERVLAHAAAAGDTWLLGTRLALYVVGDGPVHRIGWEQVDTAAWDADTSVLEVAEVGEWGEARPVHRFTLPGPGRLLDLLRERVSASVLLQRRVVVEDRRGFQVHARRSPADGAVRWFVEYDDGVDPDDLLVRTSVEVALAQARGDVEP